MAITAELKAQIEAAFDYRGHVTVTLKDGATVEGFLFNRVYADAKLKDGDFIEVILKNKDEKRRVAMTDIASVKLTGEDTAAGKSYEDYQKKKAAGA